MSVQPNVTSKNHRKIFFAVFILQFKTALHKTPVTFNSIKHFIFRQQVALVLEVTCNRWHKDHAISHSVTSCLDGKLNMQQQQWELGSSK